MAANTSPARPSYRIGQKVTYSGFSASVVEICTGTLAGMLVIRVPGGLTCVSSLEVEAAQ